MEQRTIENFKVIGRCSKMQALSWDQEVSLCDGIYYDIDFSQTFQSMYVEGLLITDVSVANLTEVIDDLTSKIVSPSAGVFPQKENDQYDEESFRNALELATTKARKEIKQEKKWKKTHEKIKKKDAWHNFVLAYEDITGEVI